MIRMKTKGDFRKTNRFFQRMREKSYLNDLHECGREGVRALSAATPVESSKTAASWDYVIERKGDRTEISWYNGNVVDGVNIAVILQYGHGTGTGGFVAGRDYINPSIRPIFDRIADKAWREVTRE